MELANKKIQIVTQAIQRGPMLSTEAADCARMISEFADFHESRKTKCAIFSATLENFYFHTGEEPHPDPLTFQHAGVTVEIVDVDMNGDAGFDYDAGTQIYRDSWSADVRMNGVTTTFVEPDRDELADSIRNAPCL